MSKISIVGVDGSGKTTLMAAFGEKYERPDEKGYSLDPKDERTHVIISTLTGAMRNGVWPATTLLSKVDVLSWTLLHRSDEQVEELGEFMFLDYAGEVYRLAFGQTVTKEECAPYVAQIAALKNHVETASALAILVNLSDVINGSRRDPRVQQMVFLTGSLIKMAIKRVGAEHVALIFSQVDKYKETIESLGGLTQVLDKYLPLVATRFPKLRMFAVSAVGQTVVDEQGNERPSQDYQPTGLEEVMDWLASCTKSSDVVGLAQARKRLVNVISYRPQENVSQQQTSPSTPLASSMSKTRGKVDSSESAGMSIVLGLIAIIIGIVLLCNGQGWGATAVIIGALTFGRGCRNL